MQHNLLSRRLSFEKSFSKRIEQLVPLYKYLAQQKAADTFKSTGRQEAYSSPVCYAHLRGMREGFDEV